MKHSNITNVLIDHLERETDYAILLNGSWGSGKSYFIKNTFIPIAKTIKTISSGGTNYYSPVLVSLFGVKSIDDLKDRVFLSLYPLLDKRYFKIGSAFSKAILKSIDIHGLISNVGSNFSKAIDKTTSTIKKELDLKDLVIILDDVERADPTMLDSNEILGYINSLVEENNIKIIIIANEETIKSENYQNIKEKTIGHTIHFEKDFDSVFSDLINGHNANFDEEFRNQRVIKTLRKWGVYVDEAYFLGGLSKDKVLKAFGAHIFFDDQDVHLKGSSKVVPSGRVPYAFDSPLLGLGKQNLKVSKNN